MVETVNLVVEDFTVSFTEEGIVVGEERVEELVVIKVVLSVEEFNLTLNCVEFSIVVKVVDINLSEYIVAFKVNELVFIKVVL